MKLTIELIPSTSFFTNLRSILSKSQWDTVRKDCYRKAKYKCEICGGKGEQHPVECHEIWQYNEKKHIQKLLDLIALCPMCHACKHIGLSQIRGIEEECIKHLCKVNKISVKKANKMISDAFKVWDERSEHKWELDVTKITDEIKREESGNWI